MDEVPDKYILSNDVQKKCARTQNVNNQCPLDVSVIVHAKRNKLLVRTSDLKHKVRGNNKYLRAMHDTHGVVMYNNKMNVPQPLCKRMLTRYHHQLSHPGATYFTKTVQ